jgi:hypothetical protein
LAVDGGDLFAGCSQGFAEVAERVPDVPAPTTGAPIRADLADIAPRAWVTGLDAGTGEEAWMRPWEYGEENCLETACYPARRTQEQYTNPILTSVATTDTMVIGAGTFHNVHDPRYAPPTTGGELMEFANANAIDRETGDFLWGTALDQGGWSSLQGTGDPSSSANVPGPVLATTPDRIYALTWRLHALAADDGIKEWSQSVSPRSYEVTTAPDTAPAPGFHGSGLAVAYPRIYASGAHEVVAYEEELTGPTTAWRNPLGLNALDQNYGFIVWADRLLGASHSGVAFVLSTANGQMSWFSDVGSSGGLRYALGEGIAVTVAQDGHVAVFGRTAASIQPALTVSERFPAVGGAVRLDLAGTGPGVLGPATEFRVEWGDGRIDTWQSEPTFEHAYMAPGEVQGRAFARNDAGQVASESFDLHVGGSPPRELNLAQQALAPENYDLTFGLLGVMLALAGGMLAVARARRRRRRVNREVAAIEAAYEATKDRPRDCEAALAERRAHVQGLGLDGRLDQPEVLLLERRLDDLARGHRLGMLESRFQFLPYGFVMSLREMLADGAISLWEREHLLRAIDADRSMTAPQKKKVRGLVEEWADRDEGVGG